MHGSQALIPLSRKVAVMNTAIVKSLRFAVVFPLSVFLIALGLVLVLSTGAFGTQQAYASVEDIETPVQSDVVIPGSNESEETLAPSEFIEQIASQNEEVQTFDDPLSGWVEESPGRFCYYDPATHQKVSGWQTIEGSQYYFDDNNNENYRVTGTYFVDGFYYRFNSDGKMHTGWFEYSLGWCYYDLVSGKELTGWHTIDGDHYYFDPLNGNSRATKYKKINGKGYNFGDDGKLQVGWVYIKTSSGSKWCFFDPITGKIVSGWLTFEGGLYYLDPANDDERVTGLKEIDGKRYLFDSNGKAHTGWHNAGTESNPLWRYYDPTTGAEVSGWVTIDGTQYYFDSNQGGILTQTGKPQDLTAHALPQTGDAMHVLLGVLLSSALLGGLLIRKASLVKIAWFKKEE